MSPPQKSQVLAVPIKKVKRWRVWIGSTPYKSCTLERAVRFAREQMWGGHQIITLEPVMEVVIPRRRPANPSYGST